MFYNFLFLVLSLGTYTLDDTFFVKVITSVFKNGQNNVTVRLYQYLCKGE